MPDIPLVDREDVRTQVDAFIAEHLTAARERASRDYGPETGALYDAMAQLLSGGKRLRAAFTYWSWRAHGGTLDSPARAAVLRVGAALELFQAAALFHDDLMDNSDTRRGHATAHIHFAQVHRDSDWPGDPAQFGLSSAVLLGDLSLVASDEVFTAAVAELPGPVHTAARAIFDNMRTEVTLGQYLDVLSQVRPWGSDTDAAEATARAVVRAKSARYSVEHPISLGAALAGASPQQVRTCEAFGLPLGEAFQLRDDILGVFGDPSQTGKPAGDDLREGKRTVLLARAMGCATHEQVAILQAKVGTPQLTDADIAELRGIIVSCGALDGIETLVSELTEQSFEILGEADLAEDGQEMLRQLGLSAVRRAS